MNKETYKVEFYTTLRGGSPVDEFLDSLAEKHRGKILQWLHYLEKEGPRLPRPYADILIGKIRELRISISHHQYRLLYFFSGKVIVVTHGFLKKSSKVPLEEIERSKRSMNDWSNRYGSGGK